MTIAHLGGLPAITEQRGGDPGLVVAELYQVIEQAVLTDPRSLQTRIGPSEIGVPCDRRLGYKLAQVPPTRPESPANLPWLPTVGRALHTFLEETFRAENRRWRDVSGEDVTRYLIEHRLYVGKIGGVDITGSCDIYDRVTASSWDWKSCGPTRMKMYRSKGPAAEYKAQGHLYGLGWEQRGMPVDTVGIVFLPRNGEWRERFHWSEPYDRQVALDALARANRLHALVAVLGAEAYTVTNHGLHARGLGVLADVGDDDALAMPALPVDCRFCEWWRPGSTDPSTGCPGDSADRAPRRDALIDLIA